MHQIIMHRKSTLGVNSTVDFSPNTLNFVRDGRSTTTYVIRIRQTIFYIVSNSISP